MEHTRVQPDEGGKVLPAGIVRGGLLGAMGLLGGLVGACADGATLSQSDASAEAGVPYESQGPGSSGSSQTTSDASSAEGVATTESPQSSAAGHSSASADSAPSSVPSQSSATIDGGSSATDATTEMSLSSQAGQTSDTCSSSGTMGESDGGTPTTSDGRSISGDSEVTSVPGSDTSSATSSEYGSDSTGPLCGWDEEFVSGETGPHCEAAPNWRRLGRVYVDGGAVIQPTVDGSIQVLMNSSTSQLRPHLFTIDSSGTVAGESAPAVGSLNTLSATGLVVYASPGMVGWVDPSGVEVASVQVASDTTGLAIAADAENNAYRVARRGSRVSVGKVKTTSGEQTLRLLDYDSSVSIREAAIDTAGEFAAVCVDTDQFQDVLLMRTDGTLVWREQTSSLASSKCTDVEVDADGDVWILEDKSILSMKDAEGTLQWSKTFPDALILSAIAVDSAANVVVGGRRNWRDVFVEKLDSTGNAQWIWPSTTQLAGSVLALNVDAEGDFWAAGKSMDELLVVHFGETFANTPACEEGSHAPATDLGTVCQTWQECPIDQYSSVVPDAFHDRQCESCPAGTKTRTFPCAGQGCCVANPAVCAPGTYVVTPGTLETPPVCEGCPVGTYSVGENAAECLPCTPGTTSDGFATDCHLVAECASASPATSAHGGEASADAGPVDAVALDAGSVDAGFTSVSADSSSTGEPGQSGGVCELPEFVHRYPHTEALALAQGPDGGIFIAESNNGSAAVRRLDAAGNTLWLWWDNEDTKATAIFYHEATNRVYAAIDGSRIIRLDVEGNVEFEWSFALSYPARVFDIVVDSQGHVYVAGSISTGTPSQVAATDGVIVKFDEMGTQLWTETVTLPMVVGNAQPAEFYRLGLDAQDNLYGLLRGRMFVNDPHMFRLYKWNSERALAWKVEINASQPSPPLWYAQATDIAVSPNGETFIALATEGVMKVATDSSIEWRTPIVAVRRYGGTDNPGTATVTAVTMDDAERVLVAGYTNGLVAEQVYSAQDMIALELSPLDGETVAARQMAGAKPNAMLASGDAMFVVGSVPSAVWGTDTELRALPY